MKFKNVLIIVVTLLVLLCISSCDDDNIENESISHTAHEISTSDTENNYTRENESKNESESESEKKTEEEGIELPAIKVP
jgi:hypothetical protein